MIPFLRILAFLAYLVASLPVSAGTLSLGTSVPGTLTLSSTWVMQYFDPNVYAPDFPLMGAVSFSGGSLSLNGNYGSTGGISIGIGDNPFGNGTISIDPGNLPPIPRTTSRTLNLGRTHGFTIETAGFASDPDHDRLRIIAVEGGPATGKIREDGTEVTIFVKDPCELRVTVEDERGARCIGTAKFTVWDAMRRYVTGYEERLVFDIPTFNLPPEELTVEIVDPATAGQATLVSGSRIEYVGAGDRITGDSFRFLVKRSGEMIADLTGIIVNVGETFAGSYLLESESSRWIGRTTMQATGAYTAVMQSPSGTIRRQGNFLTDPPSRSSEAAGLRFEVRPDESGAYLLYGYLSLSSGEEYVVLRNDSELGRLPAPRVHTLMSNQGVTYEAVMRYPGVFVEVARKVANLPSSYAVIRKGAGASITFVGRHFDGSPWTGTGYALTEYGSFPNRLIQFVGRGMWGNLRYHRNGSITGAVRGDLPNKGSFITTFGGSPFTPRASNVNVFKGQWTPVRVRTLFPADVTVPSFIDAAGRLSAEGPSGLRVSATIDRADGTVSGSVNAGAINVTRPVSGLFIPHKQMVVGFTGEEIAKPFTIQRR